MAKIPNKIKYIGFPNGMSLEEGTERAGQWWDDRGRIIMLQAFEQAEKTEDDAKSKDDGILRGLLFSQLNTREQHKVVTTWYHEQGRTL